MAGDPVKLAELYKSDASLRAIDRATRRLDRLEGALEGAGRLSRVVVLDVALYDRHVLPIYHGRLKAGLNAIADDFGLRQVSKRSRAQ